MSFLALPAAGADQPNFLLIFTDDHGYGDVSTYRKSDVHTPHIDRLAAEGMLFTTMRANCTVCSPSRAALLTGRYPDRVGVPGVIRTHPENSWGYFDPAVPTLADELKRAGYHTGIVGKWHLGLESPNPTSSAVAPRPGKNAPAETPLHLSQRPVAGRALQQLRAALDREHHSLGRQRPCHAQSQRLGRESDNDTFGALLPVVLSPGVGAGMAALALSGGVLLGRVEEPGQRES